MTFPVLGVLGGSGGVGASTFAAVLAVLAGAVLVDLDPSGGGIDVLLGIEGEAGARWSGLHVAGGRLEPAALAGGLPRAGPSPVLAADTVPEAAAVSQVVSAAAELGPVVLDLPRAACPHRAVGLARCDLVVVLARADVSGLVAAHAVTSGVRSELAGVALGLTAGAAAPTGAPVGVIVRRAVVPPRNAAGAVGAPLVGVLPAFGTRAVDPRRPPRPARRAAAGLLAGMREGLMG